MDPADVIKLIAAIVGNHNFREKRREVRAPPRPSLSGARAGAARKQLSAPARLPPALRRGMPDPCPMR